MYSTKEVLLQENAVFCKKKKKVQKSILSSAKPLKFEDNRRVNCLSICNWSKQKASVGGRGRKEKMDVMLPQP